MVALDVMIHPRVATIHGTKPCVRDGAFPIPELAVAGTCRIKAGLGQNLGEIRGDVGEALLSVRMGNGRIVHFNEHCG